MSEKKAWINCAKFIAIAAVIMDHSFGTLYTSKNISMASYFSVTLFVFLAGITSFYSNRKHENENRFKETIRRINAIFIPYAFATVIFLIAASKHFDLNTYIRYLLNFNMSGPFYYVFFYIQLVVVSPILYKITKKCNARSYSYLYHIIVLLALLAFSALSINYTTMLNIHGGGKYLLGGTYLFIYYLGMLFGNMDYSFKSIKTEIITLSIGGAFLAGWLIFICRDNFALDLHFPFGYGKNPPGVTLMVYGILMAVVIFALFSFFVDSNVKVLKSITAVFSLLGNYSLYIFLYHLLILQFLQSHFPIQDIWFRRIVYLSLMIMIPVLIKKALDLGKKWVRH